MTALAETTTGSSDVTEAVLGTCRRAKVASRPLRLATRAAKDAALLAVADALEAATARIVAANAEDLERGRAAGTSEHLLDRLALDAGRVAALAAAVREVAALPDPVGEVVRGSTLPNGLRLRELRVPMGVLGVVYEARPNVTVDVAVLALKSGNAVVLRGGSAAISTNTVLVDVVRAALEASGLPADAVQGIDEHGRDGVGVLLTARGLVDLLVPRGGAELIQRVVREATVPVIETGVGNCHVYVDASADLAQAVEVVLNAKTSRPSVCNAAETVLVHSALAADFLPTLLRALTGAGVRLHADERALAAARAAGVAAEPVTDTDWAAEYHGLEIAVGVVDSVEAAVDHIGRWSSAHTEAVMATDVRVSDYFCAAVDSAVVAVNASTRFTDGGEFGLGAEVGISTQKLHARGPMGLAELTTTTWQVLGDGHVRA
ncbi:glutamate-5-semialdehyde dehydrogenase [Paenibacillus sp. TRM 82003]|uniref:glutamate-5-semialdehyde dehydrogenase n=1 Tax=Kineococcus sp. TRM81007 TaxID=2925831 RepID=UPI001F574C68|nr:glutamate-5-semialdehyde dehydrogenase [Kineococcus sp. TRM81007]MCI2240069.1 glutamate-5-semialdehyde dehydrogenase [Kineococcus sp. TRM81007]MCI3925625.1 glutamate-5-semialdehyde dehydrogenase [Paenibacillus sp. TRM 82003]